MSENKLDLILEKLDTLQTDMTSVKMHIENVTDKNIQLIAEGHQLLNDKLNRALDKNDDVTLYKIRVNMLSEEVAKLKKEIEELKNKIA